MRISGEKNSPPSLVYIEQAQGEEKRDIKRGAKIKPWAPLLFASSGWGLGVGVGVGVGARPHTSRMYFPLLAK